MNSSRNRIGRAVDGHGRHLFLGVGRQQALDQRTLVTLPNHHDLGFEYLTNYRENVGGVTLAVTNAAARNHLHPDDSVIVVVGNASAIKADLEKKFGEVEVVKYLEYAHSVDKSS